MKLLSMMYDFIVFNKFLYCFLCLKGSILGNNHPHIFVFFLLF